MCVGECTKHVSMGNVCESLMLSKKELNGCNECPVHGEPSRSQLEVMARRTELFRTASLESGVQHGWAAFIKKHLSIDAIHCANQENAG